MRGPQTLYHHCREAKKKCFSSTILMVQGKAKTSWQIWKYQLSLFTVYISSTSSALVLKFFVVRLGSPSMTQYECQVQNMLKTPKTVKRMNIKTMPVCFSNSERIICYESLPAKPSTKCSKIWNVVLCILLPSMVCGGHPSLSPFVQTWRTHFWCGAPIGQILLHPQW
jgi:hypothetical protein